MTRKEALQIVLELADGNVLSFWECGDDEALLAEAAKQREAFRLVEKMADENG